MDTICPGMYTLGSYLPVNHRWHLLAKTGTNAILCQQGHSSAKDKLVHWKSFNRWAYAKYGRKRVCSGVRQHSEM